MIFDTSNGDYQLKNLAASYGDCARCFGSKKTPPCSAGPFTFDDIQPNHRLSHIKGLDGGLELSDNSKEVSRWQIGRPRLRLSSTQGSLDSSTLPPHHLLRSVQRGSDSIRADRARERGSHRKQHHGLAGPISPWLPRRRHHVFV